MVRLHPPIRVRFGCFRVSVLYFLDFSSNLLAAPLKLVMKFDISIKFGYHLGEIQE